MGAATRAPAMKPAAWRTGTLMAPRRMRHAGLRVASLKQTMVGPVPGTGPPSAVRLYPGSAEQPEEPVGHGGDPGVGQAGDLSDQAGDEQQHGQQRTAHGGQAGP